MGKIRPQYANSNLDTPAGIAQWIGRKIRNHDPLEKLDARPQKLAAKFRQIADGNGDIAQQPYCGIVKSNPAIIHHGLMDGRVFEITVRQIDPEVAADTQLIAVGI